jgi:hypothetical protein
MANPPLKKGLNKKGNATFDISRFSNESESRKQMAGGSTPLPLSCSSEDLV